MTRPALLRRAPSLLYRPAPDAPLVPPDRRPASLAADFAVLEQRLVPVFRKLDHAALRQQNRFRLQQLALIVGGLVTTIFGAIQAGEGGGLAWVGAVQAVLGVALGLLAQRAQTRRAQRGYVADRLRAERLRGEYFRFLARAGAYTDDPGREALLQARVDQIARDEREP